MFTSLEDIDLSDDVHSPPVTYATKYARKDEQRELIINKKKSQVMGLNHINPIIR